MWTKALSFHRQALIIACLSFSSILLAQTGAKYLIITDDRFYDAVQPLAAWKTMKGVPCRVVRTSETGTSNTAIRSYIVNSYMTWSPRPEFVLLVGSGSYIPAFQKGTPQSRILTDNSYGNIMGDCRAELNYGRFPCRSARECSTMVAKTIAYERTPYLDDTMWYRRATAVTGDSGDSDAPTYWADIRFVAAQMAGAGYDAVDTLASSHHNTAADVTQSVNNGTSFVLYRGTATDAWHTPFDMRPQFQYLANGNRLPIICSFTCQTISLDNFQDSMTGNTWARTGTPTDLDAGVACIGNTHSAVHVAGQRSSMTHGFFTGVFAESVPNLGSALLRGQLQIYNDFHDSIECMGFNLFGDPELNIWTTTPQPIAVVHDPEIAPGPDSFAVTVTRNGAPVNHALVCVQGQADSVYQYGYTDANGRKTLFITPTVEGTLNVTVTGRNCIPYEGQVQVVGTGVADRRLPTRLTPLRLTVSPNPGRDFVRIDCEPGAAVRVFNTCGKLVGDFPTSSGLIQINARSLPAGVYVAEAGSDRGTASTLFQIVR